MSLHLTKLKFIITIDYARLLHIMYDIFLPQSILNAILIFAFYTLHFPLKFQVKKWTNWMIRTEFPSMLFNIAVCLHGKWDYRECVHGNISSADHCPLFPETGPQGPPANDIWRKNYLSLYGGCILYEVGVFSSIIVSRMSEILNNTRPTSLIAMFIIIR